MSWLTDEILFYGGLTVGVCSLIAGLICFFASKARGVRLTAQMEKEYGPEDRKYGAESKQGIS